MVGVQGCFAWFSINALILTIYAFCIIPDFRFKNAFHEQLQIVIFQYFVIEIYTPFFWSLTPLIKFIFLFRGLSLTNIERGMEKKKKVCKSLSQNMEK